MMATKTARRRMDLVFDRLWLCGEIRNCGICRIKTECQQLFDDFDNRDYHSPESVEAYLEQFQSLLAGIASK